MAESESKPQQQQQQRQQGGGGGGAGTTGGHSRGGVSTRDDALDSGAPMLAGDPSERSGPEDALGPGPKRGDYRETVGARRYTHSVPNPDYDPADPTSPAYVIEDQTPNVENIGEAKGLKGGVETEGR